MARARSRVGALTPGQRKARQTRRWLALPSGKHLRLPGELKGTSKRAQESRAAWEEMHLAGDLLAAAREEHGVHSADARRAHRRTIEAQDQLLSLLGLEREEVVASYSQFSQHGRDSLSLLRY